MTPWTRWYGELCWVAGFLEGEGSFLYNKDHSMIICASQKEIDPLLRLQALLGGTIYLNTSRDRNPIHKWSLHTVPQAIGTMMTLYLFMSPRRQEQISRCLRAWHSFTYRAHGCTNGHLWTPENTLYQVRTSGKEQKVCRACKSDLQKIRWRKNHPVPRKLKAK